MLTYRSDELHRRHPLQPLLAGLDRSGRAERLEVDRFERADLADLLAGILEYRPTPGCSSGSTIARRATPSSPRSWWPPGSKTTDAACRPAWRTWY